MFKNFEVGYLKKSWMFVIFDIFAIVGTYLLTYLALTFIELSVSISEVLHILPVIVLLHLIIYFSFGVYSKLNDYFSFNDVIKISLGTFVTNILIVIGMTVFELTFFMRTTYIFIIFVELILISIPRIARRLVAYIKIKWEWGQALSFRTIIIGAGDVGEMVVREVYQNKDLNNMPVAFLDDNKKKIGAYLSGIKIVGKIEELERYIKELEIEEVIVAIKDYPKDKLEQVTEIANKHRINVKFFNGMHGIDEKTQQQRPKIKDIKIEDLLNRDEIELSDEEICKFIKDEVVLVTGGGGSIGSELCRQIASYDPKQLIIFDIYENNAYEIQQELLRKYKKENKPIDLKVWIGSVYNKHRVKDLFDTFNPTLVFHAAAYKHVPLMEDSAIEAIRTNVVGTYNVAKTARSHKTKKFVMVSSDKAVRSTNIMGATKRYAELIVQALQNDSDFTKFSAVRFGNVLGSNGSVIPLFTKQIEDGGPLTVTHKEITRYFMTIPEAVGLILQSGSFAHGGEVFILDMGEPVKILNLAERMIRLKGLVPYENINIEITGLRPGEKLYEELLVNHDNKCNLETAHEKIFIEKQRAVSFEDLQLEKVFDKVDQYNNESVKDFVSSIIETYKRNGE
ncbi:polysaccharide biosynthesis protein [Mycoplasmatota bacterium]|nr:polysaccharide biosynthesis protein [Mycoplasmatota bacterium]